MAAVGHPALETYQQFREGTNSRGERYTNVEACLALAGECRVHATPPNVDLAFAEDGYKILQIEARRMMRFEVVQEGDNQGKYVGMFYADRCVLPIMKTISEAIVSGELDSEHQSLAYAIQSLVSFIEVFHMQTSYIQDGTALRQDYASYVNKVAQSMMSKSLVKTNHDFLFLMQFLEQAALRMDPEDGLWAKYKEHIANAVYGGGMALVGASLEAVSPFVGPFAPLTVAGGAWALKEGYSRAKDAFKAACEEERDKSAKWYADVSDLRARATTIYSEERYEKELQPLIQAYWDNNKIYPMAVATTLWSIATDPSRPRDVQLRALLGRVVPEGEIDQGEHFALVDMVDLVRKVGPLKRLWKWVRGKPNARQIIGETRRMVMSYLMEYAKNPEFNEEDRKDVFSWIRGFRDEFDPKASDLKLKPAETYLKEIIRDAQSIRQQLGVRGTNAPTEEEQEALTQEVTEMLEEYKDLTAIMNPDSVLSDERQPESLKQVAELSQANAAEEQNARDAEGEAYDNFLAEMEADLGGEAQAS